MKPNTDMVRHVRADAPFQARPGVEVHNAMRVGKVTKRV